MPRSCFLTFLQAYARFPRGAELGEPLAPLNHSRQDARGAQRGHCKTTHHVVQIDEGIIDGHHLDFARKDGSPGDQAANTAKSGEKQRGG